MSIRPSMTRWGRLLMRPLRWCWLVLCVVGCAYGKHIDRGDELMTKGHYDQALSQYEAALALDPEEIEAQIKVSEAKSALIRQSTGETRALLDGGDYVGAILSARALYDRLPDASPVDTLMRDVASRTKQAADHHAEQEQWADSLSLMQALYEHFDGERAELDPRINEVRSTWAASLRVRAEEAEQAGHFGDALLLHAKANSLVMDPASVAKRDELHARLIDTHAYRVALNGRGKEAHEVIGRLLGQRLAQNVVMTDAASKDDSSQVMVHVEVAPAQVDLQRSTSMRAVRYKSGTRQEPNPSYQRYQDDVIREERDLHRYEDDLSSAERDVSRYQMQVDREAPSPNTSTGAEQSLSRAQSARERARDHVDRARNRVLRSKERMHNTDPMIEVDVFSNLDYVVTHYDLLATSQIELRVLHEDGRPPIVVREPLGRRAQDDEHAEHAIAGVRADPLDLPPEQDLVDTMWGDGVTLTMGAIGQSLQAKRADLLQEAFALQDDGARAHLYVVYILLDPRQVDPQVVAELASLRGIPDSVKVLSSLK